MKKKATKNDVNDISSPNNFIIIAKELKFYSSENDSNVELIRLRHPRSKEPVQFLHNSAAGTLQECWKFFDNCRSWFIGNSVNSQGMMLLCTCIDPLFLILPYLAKSKKYRVFDEIVHDDDIHDSSKLECFVNETELTMIADKKDCGGLTVWRYNDDKVITWLIGKVHRVANVLRDKHLNVNASCAVSKTYVKSSLQSDDAEYLRYSHGVVSEYLDPILSTRLLVKLDLTESEENLRKRKNPSLDKEEIKRIRLECVAEEAREKEKSNSTNSEKVLKKSSRQIALAKAAVGSKNISNFFKKK